MFVTNIETYLKGKEACMKVESDPTKMGNPYEPETEEWYSWNQGWNSI